MEKQITIQYSEYLDMERKVNIIDKIVKTAKPVVIKLENSAPGYRIDVENTKEVIKIICDDLFDNEEYLKSMLI